MRRQLTPRSRADLLAWSEPLFTDLIADFHARLKIPDAAMRRRLTSTQVFFWKALLPGERARYAPARAALVAAAGQVGVEMIAIDDVDDAVLYDLSDVTVSRFLRTPSLAQVYSQNLLEAATALGALRGVEKARAAAPTKSPRPIASAVLVAG